MNNVFAFPYLFRVALDVHAKKINEAMKLAAIQSLASLAKESVTNKAKVAYNKNLFFGKEYIIPKPLDTRLITMLLQILL